MKANDIASSLHRVGRMARQRTRGLVTFASLVAGACVISQSTWAQDWNLNSGGACSHIGGCSVNVTGGGGSYNGGGGGRGSGETCDSACRQRNAEERDRAFNNAIGVKAYNLIKKANEEYEKIYDKSRGCPNKKMANMASSWRGIWANRGNDLVPFEAWQWDEVTGDILSCYTKSLPVGTAEWHAQYARAYGNYLRILYPFYPDRSVTAEHTVWYGGAAPDSGDVKRILWKLWTMQYNAGRHCPEPPNWNGTVDGCVGRSDVPHTLDSGYVPLPTTAGTTWTLRNFLYSKASNITITDKNNRPIDMNDMHLVKIMDGMTVVTGESTNARFTLPDTDHDIVLSANSKVKFLGFTYDPNTLSAVMTIDNFRGNLRVLTSKIANALGQHSIEIRNPSEWLVAVKGSDVELNQNDIGVEVCTFDGDAQVTYADRAWDVPKGGCFGGNGNSPRWSGMIGADDEKTHFVPHITFCDRWDMTPWNGRELQ